MPLPSALTRGALPPGALLPALLLLAACGGDGITAPGAPIQHLVSISASVWHTCAVANGGDGYCWGANESGQAGIGRNGADVNFPSRIASNARWASVQVGFNHTCGMTTGGVVSCWGSDHSGQLGNGLPLENDSVPATPVRGPPFRSISLGYSHTCALGEDGVAYCWGDNHNGQLGDGNTFRAGPVAVEGGLRFSTIASGADHTCALTADGVAWCWGGNDHGQLGLGASGGSQRTPQQVTGDLRFSQLSAGEGRTCAVTLQGLAHCWGSNSDGALGDGTTERRDAPTPVSGGLIFRSVAAGAFHSCGLAADNRLFCWGRNADGELGNGSLESSSVPSEVDGNLRFNAVSVGALTTCAISSDSAPYCWGRALFDGTVTRTLTPRRLVIVRGQRAPRQEPDTTIIPAQIAFASVVAGNNYACGIDRAGHAYCWTAFGSTPFIGESGSRAEPLPKLVPGGLRWKQLAAGYRFVCGVATDASAYCWGRNRNGELGTGTESDSEEPVAVAGGLRFASITAGHSGGHTCGVTESGAALCWGYNGAGQLGNGRIEQSVNVPELVTGGIRFKSLTAGSSYTCGLTPPGDVYCWGSNSYDVRGPDSVWNRTTPAPTAPGLRFRSLVAGVTHTCGVSADGLANYCWGNNESGQIGLGTRSYSVPNPTPTPTIPSLQTITTGVWHTCGATNQDEAYCWGFAFWGELGTGERFSAVPTRVVGGHRFPVISTGYEVTCGLTPEGSLYCWGDGYGSVPRLVSKG